MAINLEQRLNVYLRKLRKEQTKRPIKSMKQRRRVAACRYMLSESEAWSKNWPCINFDEKQRTKYSIR